MRIAAVAAAWLLLSVSAFAQNPPDPRWSPWVGCWQVEVDGTAGRFPTRTPQARVCVDVEGPGVAITTTAGGAPPMTERLTADGMARPMTEGGCTGTQQAEWSSDGFRLYSHAELSCGGGTRREVSGVSILTPAGTWIEAQSIGIGSRSSVRVRRFTKEGGAPSSPARGRLTVAQVHDASRHVAAAALEAALVEARATFALNRSSLIALDEAGVPASVIDVMVALTYPQAFAIHPASRADRLTPFPFDADAGDAAAPWWPGALDAFGGYFGSAYYFSPFGYSAIGTYPVFFGVNGGDGGGGGGAHGGAKPVGGGRVINGLGYTRLAPRTAEEAASSGGGAAATGQDATGGTVTSRGYTRSGGGSDTASGSAGGAASSSGGSSGGSSSSGGGRSAVDR